ncbi:MAG TPA: hypothetical protein VF458_00235 [Ktedonobacteraceae bacterium]
MSSMYPSFGGAPARPCMRCGTPLTINETQCSRCGMFNPLPQGQQFGGIQQGAQGGGPGPSGPLWGGQAQQASQYQQNGNGAWSGNQDASASAWGSKGQAGGGWQQNNLFGGQDATPPPQSLQNNAFGTGFGGQNQSSFSNFQQNPNQSALNNSFGGSNFQQNAERPSLNSFMQATRQNGSGGSSLMAPNRPAWTRRPSGDDYDDDRGKGKNRPGAGVVIVIIVLLVVLLGGGGYGGYYFYKHRNDGAATPTTTTQAIATPTGTPQFSDFFKNNANKWDTHPPAGAQVTLNGDGKLVLESDNNKLFPEFVPGGKTYADLEVDVDAGLSGGDPNNGYGVYIRTASTQNSVLGLYYRFEIYGNGLFYIYKGSVDNNGAAQANSLKNSLQPSNAIALTGKPNHLTIIAKGQTLTFKVNGTILASFTDPSYKSGNVALFVSQVKDATSSARATFQNLAIFPAP